MRRPLALPLLCILVTLVLACDSEQRPAADDGDKTAQTKDNGKSAGDAKPAADGGAAAVAGGAKVFAKDKGRQRCAEVTPEFLGALFDFEAEKLDKMRPKPGKNRCNYQWEDDDEFFFANIGSMWVRKSEDGAKQHFANATANKTQDEIKADMGKVDKKIEEDATLDSAAKEKVAKTTTSAFAMMTEQGVTYDPIDGIGDEAKVSSRDGGVWVRVGNAVMTFTAYRGPGKKTLMKDGRPVSDIKQIMDHERQWVQSTLKERKAASIKLAEACMPLVLKLAK